MSGNDFWSPYQRKPGKVTEKTALPKVQTEYAAFDAKDSVDRLKIRRVNNPTRAPGYVYLLDLVYYDDYGTGFILVFTFLTVIVRGHGLLPVIAAIEMGSADFIQEFDENRWKKPADQKAPFIESIRIEANDRTVGFAEAEKMGKEKQRGLNVH